MADSLCPRTPPSAAADAGAAVETSPSAASSASSPTSVASATGPQSAGWRERRRLSERKSREKRKARVLALSGSLSGPSDVAVCGSLQGNLERMRSQIQVLECAAANVPYVLASETVADDGARDDDQRAMRDFLRRSMALEREKERLRAQNRALAAMVQHREQPSQALRQLTRCMSVDPWAQHVERWREITLETFTDWTHEACLEVVHDSMRKIAAFSFDDDRETETTGMSFMGWRDRRRLDAATATIHFSFTKTYDNTDAEAMARGYWDMHLDSAAYARCMLGPNVKCHYEIVQHVSPDICVVRCVEQYPSVPVKIHMLFLIFRVRTRNGFVQCLRSLPCPELQLATLDDDAFWTTNFHWVRWDITARDTDTGACARVRSSVNGSIASNTVDYANRWMGEAILTLVRAESILLGRNLLKV